MSRLKTTATLPKVAPQQRKNFITETRSYRLITPLYGGGVKPEKADPVTVIRATEIRGHLRFWWRATRGGAYKNLAEMRQYEEAIFGSAAGDAKTGQSKVHVFVSEAHVTQKLSKIKTRNGENVHISDPKSPYSYVAFPLRGDDNKPEGDLLKEGVTFSIAFSYPQEAEMPEGKKINIAQELEAALWAWETFGGIGARTRRGFGALHRTDIPLPQDLSTGGAGKWIEKGIKKYVIENEHDWYQKIPHLNQNMRYHVIKYSKPMEAWGKLINKLASFRQQDARYAKKTGNKSKYGMSVWPEANEIRHLFGKKRAVINDVSEGSFVEKFPRADFGLPIIFKFKDEEKGEPKQTTLEGKNNDRLASPLILRPLICKDGAIGIALILDTPRTPPEGLILKGAPKEPSVESQLTANEAKKIPILNGETDILKAFLDTL